MPAVIFTGDTYSTGHAPLTAEINGQTYERIYGGGSCMRCECRNLCELLCTACNGGHNWRPAAPPIPVDVEVL